MAATRQITITCRRVWGLSPVQGQGTVQMAGGAVLDWYYRAQHGAWMLTVGREHQDPVYVMACKEAGTGWLWSGTCAPFMQRATIDAQIRACLEMADWPEVIHD